MPRRREQRHPPRARPRHTATPRRPPPFRLLVYRLVRRVPRGKVVTYGQVAALLGRPRAARAVGTALGALRGSLIGTVPWQRVISGAGRCSHRDGFSASVQRDLLEREGVRFDRRGHVDLRKARWAGPRRGTPNADAFVQPVIASARRPARRSDASP